mmetsp:Transcript_23651/g.55137  ORF Transcript_23651/g.55137 Transcript_23651/m.55137 type:complete len:175 (-) Transcript_23651:41-565(-)
MSDRTQPNILVTGTPGVGKTSFCEALVATSRLTHLEVAKLIKDEKLYKEWDDEMDCSIFEEEMVLDHLEPLLEQGGQLVDFHSAGFLPAELFDLVIVLRADTSTLFARLEKRRYPEEKIQENVQAEIFQTCLDEANEAFEDSSVKIVELQHDTPEQLEKGVETVMDFIRKFAPS